ncbi:MAG TPA: ABC transporter permease [Nocardioidaceae bacterium]|nr:ABC transporter permease [Nocardioidaceae bacterium]
MSRRPQARPLRLAAFWSLSAALAKGFFRDRMSVFFAIVFPLMFLVLFGGILDFGSSQLHVVRVGEVPMVEQLAAPARQSFDEAVDLTTSTDRDEALAEVRRGDADAMIEMRGDTLVVHYSEADQVKSAVTRGTLQAFVDAANVAASGQPPAYSMRTERVEDESLEAIQFVTPGLLGWAVAMSAAFGAASTLQGWRVSKLLRRLRLSPASTAQIVSARIVVTIAIALVQMAIFLGLGMAAFGLQLTGAWWMGIPLLVAGTLAFMSIGLLAGALARTTEGAVNLANFIVLPMAFLSGSFFSLEGAPRWLQVVSQLMPLRHLNDAMSNVMVRGMGPASTTGAFAILLGFALVLGALAVRLFRWDSA